MKKLALSGLALGLAAGALFSNSHPSDSRGLATASRTTATATDPVRAIAARAVSANTSTHPAAIVPDNLRRVLPSVTSRVDHWRDFDPAHIAVAIAPGSSIDFEHISTKRMGAHGEYTVWTGRNPDLPGAGLIGVGFDGGWSGTLSLPGAREYQITVEGDQVAITPKISGACSVTVAMTQDGQSILDVPPSGTARAEGTAASVVDVMFFYNDEVVQRYGSASVQRSVEVEAVSQIERANQILQQSKVDTLQWRFVGAEKVPSYATPSGIEEDLRMFAMNNNAVGQFVQSRMVALGADQAVLYIAQRRASSGNTVGIANTPGHHSVVLIQADSLATAHEMAHNFGCMHDRQTDSVPDRDTHYYFGHRFRFQNRDSGTVMSYAPNLLPYFSNPDVQIDSGAIVIGTSEKIAGGVPEGQPKAADNARWLREHAQAMAATRTSAEAPRITTQPGNATLTVGQTLTLNVTASGSDLTYQWQKDGVAVSGATGSTYTKSNAQVTDAGSYTVVVSNRAGSVTSAAATVSIAAATTSPPPGSAGGSSGASSGGGGGAMSDWALAALAALGALRAWQRRRSEAAGSTSP